MSRKLDFELAQIPTSDPNQHTADDANSTCVQSRAPTACGPRLIPPSIDFRSAAVFSVPPGPFRKTLVPDRQDPSPCPSGSGQSSCEPGSEFGAQGDRKFARSFRSTLLGTLPDHTIHEEFFSCSYFVCTSLHSRRQQIPALFDCLLKATGRKTSRESLNTASPLCAFL